MEITSSKLYKTIKNLSDSEKSNLLDKFGKISPQELDNSSDSDLKLNFSGYEKSKENLKRLKIYIEEIQNSASFFYKFIIWLTAIIYKKNKDDIIVDNELNKLKKELKYHYSDFFNPDFKRFEKNFIKEIIELIKIVKEERKKFTIYLEDPIYYCEFLVDILESRFYDHLKEAKRLLEPDSLGIKATSLTKDEYIKEKEKRLKLFFNLLDTLPLTSLVNQINNFQMILLLVKFQYDELLKNFYIFDVNDPLTNENSCEYGKIEYLVESFYKLIYSINFKIDDISFIDNIPIYASKNKKENEKEIEDEDIQIFEKLLKTVTNIKNNIPFQKIFQFTKSNLIYTPKISSVDVDFINIYKDYKKTITTKVWDEYFDGIKIKKIEDGIVELFKTKDFTKLENFNLNFKSVVDRSGIIVLRYVYLINLIQEFLKTIYKSKIETVINKCLIEGTFDKDFQKSSLSNAYYLLSTMVNRIALHDAELSDEKDLKVQIVNMIRKLHQDTAYKISLINVITDINDNSRKMFIEFKNEINVVKDFFKSVIETKNIKIANIERIKIPGYANAITAFEKSLELLDQFIKLVSFVEDVYDD